MTEIELKFHVPDGFGSIREKLLSLGFTELPGRRESNHVLDTDPGDGALLRKGVLLRIRATAPLGDEEPDGMTAPGEETLTLTVKTMRGVERLASEFPGMKTRMEHELELRGEEAGRTIFDILAALGYREVYRYRKVRREFHRDGVSVCLDELDFGKFVEIESGDGRRVERTARALGLDPGSGLSESYVALGLEAGRGGGREGRTP